MADELEGLRDNLSLSLDQLIAERDAALDKKDMAKVTTAEAEADRVGVILATVQFAINKKQAMNMNAVAARLRESIEAQRAVGLSTARKTLEGLLKQIGGAPADDATRGRKKKKPPAQPAGGDIRALPGTHQIVVDKLIAGAKSHGLDPMTVLTFIAIESDFNPTAASPVSSAAGLFQFIDSTWKAAGGPSFPGRGGKGNGQAAGAPVDVQIEIGCAFVAENFKQLSEKLKQAPSVMMLYMAHQQGLKGALAILSADKNLPIESVIGDDAARNNAFGGLTVGQTIEKFNAVVRSNEDEARALVTVASAPSDEDEAEEGAPQAGSILPRAVRVSLNEMEMFARKNGAILRETQEPLSTRVLEYFRLVGRPDITNTAATPWSAAFISFVMNSAGAGPTQFPISASHSRYILTGLANRKANRFNASMVYFDRNERAPKVGDLIGFSRTAQVKDRADMEDFLPDRHFDSHTDLVIDVSPGRIKVIGGNVSQTILTKTVKADAAGKIDPSEEHFFVLQMNM